MRDLLPILWMVGLVSLLPAAQPLNVLFIVADDLGVMDVSPYNPDTFYDTPAQRYFSPYGNPRLTDGPDGEHLPDRLATETSNFIAKHKNQPFLAYLSFYSVHTPLMGQPDLVEKYEKRRAERGLKDDFAEEPPRKNRITQSHAVYAAMVEAMDQAIGKVLAALETNGVADNTIVIFTSDNGGLSTSEGSPTANLPYRAGKGWLYEGGIPGSAVRRGDWKLIHWFWHKSPELFHLANDPGEQQNLAEKNPEIVADLQKVLSGFHAETKALMPHPNPKPKQPFDNW